MENLYLKKPDKIKFKTSLWLKLVILRTCNLIFNSISHAFDDTQACFEFLNRDCIATGSLGFYDYCL